MGDIVFTQNEMYILSICVSIILFTIHCAFVNDNINSSGVVLLIIISFVPLLNAIICVMIIAGWLILLTDDACPKCKY